MSNANNNSNNNKTTHSALESKPQNGGSLHRNTILAQAGSHADASTGAVSCPVHFSTTFSHPALGQSTGFDYSRTTNPTRAQLEQTVALLDGGVQAFAFSSGMAALDCCLRLFKPGDSIAVLDNIYGGSYRLFEAVFQKAGYVIDYFTVEQLNDPGVHLQKDYAGIFIESVTNPTLQELDIGAIANHANQTNSLLIVDNTFYTPILLKPLELGAHIVIHSSSKYISGHNDVLSGLVIAGNSEIALQIGTLQNTTGATLGPLDSWLILRGLKTLAIRMQEQQSNAQKIAAFLHSHPAVQTVYYPGKGAMVACTLYDESQAAGILPFLKVWIFAESLGGTESLITIPSIQTHADMPARLLEQNHITPALLRLSVGLEYYQDLMEDLDNALLQYSKQKNENGL
jgi:cystathionine gamma-synthase